MNYEKSRTFNFKDEKIGRNDAVNYVAAFSRTSAMARGRSDA